MKEILINHISVTYGAIGLTGFWNFFQENAKYVIFAGGIYFAGKEWQKKATGKMIMMIVVAAVLFVCSHTRPSNGFTTTRSKTI